MLTLPIKLLLLKAGVKTTPVTVFDNVRYGITARETMDLYLINDGKYHPAVVLIHGGGWQGGDKNVYKGTAAKFNAAGFHAAAINYRLATAGDNPWPAQLEDCQLAVRWLRSVAEIYKIHRNQIVANGASAGAHLSLMLGSRDTMPDLPRSKFHTQWSSRVCAVLDWSGPTDLTTPHMQSLASIDQVFGPYDQQAYQLASPVTYVSNNTSPVCIIHGTRDDVVEYQQSQLLQARLLKHGVKHYLIPFDGGHDLSQLSPIKKEMLEYQGMVKLLELAGL